MITVEERIQKTVDLITDGQATLIYNLLRDAIIYQCRLENSNPDIGMGMSASTIVNDTLDGHNIPHAAVDYESLLLTAHKILR